MVEKVHKEKKVVSLFMPQPMMAQPGMMQQPMVMQQPMMMQPMMVPGADKPPAAADSSSWDSSDDRRRRKKKRRKSERRRRRDDESDEGSAADERVTDDKVIPTNSKTLGFQKRGCYGVAERFDLFQCLLGSKLNPVQSNKVTVQMVDKCIFLLTGAGPDSPMCNFRRMGISTHGQLKTCLLSNLQQVGVSFWEELTPDLANLDDLLVRMAAPWNPAWRSNYKESREKNRCKVQLPVQQLQVQQLHNSSVAGATVAQQQVTCVRPSPPFVSPFAYFSLISIPICVLHPHPPSHPLCLLPHPHPSVPG